MNDKQKQNHFHFPGMDAAIILLLALVAAGLFFLHRGLQNGDDLAVAIAAIASVIIIQAITLGAVSIMRHMDAEDDRQRFMEEQSRFRDNLAENATLMASLQKSQNAQNAMLLKQAREAQRALPAPENDVIDVGLQFPDDFYSELSAEELEG